MAKSKKKKVKKKVVIKSTLSGIEQTRTGGAIALTGFDYQCLYSCYIILQHLISYKSSIRLEGIEDIDTYICNDTCHINHIQVKYSEKRQNASYLKSILKNFLEVYLCDSANVNRNFILVYDFDITDGQFKRLIQYKQDEVLDSKMIKHWSNVVNQIKEETPYWNWNNFSFVDFSKQLKFERVGHFSLQGVIEKMLIERYGISTGNEMLYAHSLFYFCFTKMKSRETVSKKELDTYIAEVTDSINRGTTNPAVHWVKPVEFDKLTPMADNMYYEGKKATPYDIVAGFPVPRPNLEKTIRKSIDENVITVIKASSGQGKTTLAWRVAYEARNEYSIYLISWCMDTKELDSIAEFIRSKIKIGEIPLIIFDNLDAQLKEWNRLAYLLQISIGTNYKLLITARESDWYIYSGDQSDLRNLKIINIELNDEQAKEIYETFVTKKLVHPKIKDWQSAWEQIEGKGLLIEYVYLLTHGKMLVDRIAVQMKEIEQHHDKDIEFDVLQKVCFADTLGIRLSSEKLCAYYHRKYNTNISNIIRHFENEFIMTDSDIHVYISGLHPVRSQHLLDFIDRYYPRTNTILDLIEIIEDIFVSKLYANLPLYTSEYDREEFYQGLIDRTKSKSYKYFLNALKGLFSGSIYAYYCKHQEIFDDVNNHGGLFIFLTDINPYGKLQKFDTEIQTIASLNKSFPDDKNITYLKSLVDSIDKFIIMQSDYYVYAYHLYSDVLKNQSLKAIMDDYSSLVYWLVNIDNSFNLLSAATMDHFWKYRSNFSPQVIAELMLSWYLADETEYMKYVTPKKSDIFNYLKLVTQSVKLFENNDNSSIHVEYLLLPSEIQSGNTESVERLNLICKFLPIYDLYCADSVQPRADILDSIKTPNDSHKEMPKRNITISFHQEYVNLWSNTILSNYEAPTVFDWLESWATIRQKIVEIYRKNISFLDKKLNQREISNDDLANFDTLHNEIVYRLRMEYPYPRQNRPFEKNNIPKETQSFTKKYFPSVRNYLNQAVGLLMRTESESRLAILNLRNAKLELNEMQSTYRTLAQKSGYYSNQHEELEKIEQLWIERLLAYCQYYLNNPNTRIVTQNNIMNWVLKQNAGLMYQVRNSIELNKLFTMSFEYPASRVDDGTLYTLPLISDNIDLTDNNIATGLILTLLPLVAFEIDFIVIILKSGQEHFVKHIGVRISKDFLTKAAKVIEKNDDSYLADSFFPLPFEITRQLLDVFETNYTIGPQDESSRGYDLFFEKLWKYAQLKKYITTPDEHKCFTQMLENTRAEIDLLFNSLPNDQRILFEYSLNLKNKVMLEGYDFDNIDYNDALNFIIHESNSR